MASSGIRVGLVVVLVAITCGGAMAQSSCTTTLMTLSPCLNYVTGNSSSPSSSCCSQLGNVVQTSPLCLCSLLNNSGASLGVNRTLALNLPGACKIQTPSINQCKAATAPTASATSPVSSPASSPADSSDQTPEPDTTPSESDIPSASGTGSGSKKCFQLWLDHPLLDLLLHSAITRKVHITVQNPTNSSVEPIIVNKKNSFCNPSILFLEGEAYVSS